MAKLVCVADKVKNFRKELQDEENFSKNMKSKKKPK